MHGCGNRWTHGCLDCRHIRLCWLEGMAAFFYVFVVAAAKAVGGPALEFISFAAGVAVMVSMFAFYGCTGNPILLLDGAFSRRIPFFAFLMGIICQFAGALVAAVTVQYGLTKDLVVPALVGPIPQYAGFIAEMIGMFFVVITYLVSESFKHKGIKPIFVGFCYVAIGWAIAPISSACLNFWYALSTSIITGIWNPEAWIYYVGPIVSGIVGLLMVWAVGLRARHHCSYWDEYDVRDPQKTR